MKVEHPEDWIGKTAILVIQPKSYVQISSEIPVEMVKDWDMEGVFVSANKPYQTVRESFGKLGILDKIVFVDCASRLGGDNPQGERLIVVNNPADLTQLAIHMSKSIDSLGEKRFLVFDSLTTLLIYSKLATVTQFAHNIGLMMKSKKVTCFFLVVEQEATKEMLSYLCTIADEFVKVEIGEGGQTIVA